MLMTLVPENLNIRWPLSARAWRRSAVLGLGCAYEYGGTPVRNDALPAAQTGGFLIDVVALDSLSADCSA